MKFSVVLIAFGLILLGNTGCGPLQVPLPPRTDEKGQKEIDLAWNQALQPLNRFDHQTLLDILMETKAYEVGVDRLTLRSEKKVAAGMVVMEVHFDRLLPVEDRFEVQVLDPAGRLLRKERYSREEIDKTYQELFVEYQNLQRQSKDKLTAEEARRLAQYEARLKVVEDTFPKNDSDKESKAKPGKNG